MRAGGVVRTVVDLLAFVDKVGRVTDGDAKPEERGGTVFARISTFEGVSEQTAEGIRVARRQFLPAARLQEGFRGMYLMLDAAGGRSLAMTLWETRGTWPAARRPCAGPA